MKPTQPGWYRVRTPWMGWQVVKVTVDHGRLYVCGPDEPLGGRSLDDWPALAEWVGPIDPVPARRQEKAS